MDEEETLSPLSAWVYRHLEGRETLKWLVSHVFIYVGMVFLICGYCVIGAFTFQYLENSAIHEKRAEEGKTDCWEELKNAAVTNRTLVIHKLYNKTYGELSSFIWIICTRMIEGGITQINDPAIIHFISK